MAFKDKLLKLMTFVDYNDRYEYPSPTPYSERGVELIKAYCEDKAQLGFDGCDIILSGIWENVEGIECLYDCNHYYKNEEVIKRLKDLGLEVLVKEQFVNTKVTLVWNSHDCHKEIDISPWELSVKPKDEDLNHIKEIVDNTHSIYFDD